MAQIIYKHHLEDLARELTKKFRLIAPTETHPHSTFSKIAFGAYETGAKLALDYPTSILPPKEFLLPREDILFEFEGEKITIPKNQKTLFYGVSIEDLEGIQRLREIFSKPIEDEPFLARSKNTFVVAIDRFSPPKDLTFDLYLQKISAEKYAAFAGSKLGKEILASKLFKNERTNFPKVTKGHDPLFWDPMLPRAIEKSKNDPIWDDLAQKCFACGICSFVCPVCYCFEEEDKLDFPVADTLKGQRVRTWNTCFSEDFAKTAGHNFRPDRRDRIYNWYFHKFVRMPKELGFPGCVDCNRCVIYCPAKINYRMVVTEILDEYKKNHPNEKL